MREVVVEVPGAEVGRDLSQFFSSNLCSVLDPLRPGLIEQISVDESG